MKISLHLLPTYARHKSGFILLKKIYTSITDVSTCRSNLIGTVSSPILFIIQEGGTESENFVTIFPNFHLIFFFHLSLYSYTAYKKKNTVFYKIVGVNDFYFLRTRECTEHHNTQYGLHYFGSLENVSLASRDGFLDLYLSHVETPSSDVFSRASLRRWRCCKVGQIAAFRVNTTW